MILKLNNIDAKPVFGKIVNCIYVQKYTVDFLLWGKNPKLLLHKYLNYISDESPSFTVSSQQILHKVPRGEDLRKNLACENISYWEAHSGGMKRNEAKVSTCSTPN